MQIIKLLLLICFSKIILFSSSLKKVGLKYGLLWQACMQRCIQNYRAEDVKDMCETIDKFIAVKKEPKLIFLKRLGENKNTPDELYIRLLKFENRFEYVKDKNYNPIESMKSQLKGMIAERGEFQK